MAGDYYVSAFNQARYLDIVKPHLEAVQRGEGSDALYQLLVEGLGRRDKESIRALEVAAIFHAKARLGIKPRESEFDLLLDVGGLLFQSYCDVPSRQLVDLTSTHLLSLLSAESTAWAELDPETHSRPPDKEFEACLGPYARILEVSRLSPDAKSLVVPPNFWRTSEELDLLREIFRQIESNSDLGLAFSVEW